MNIKMVLLRIAVIVGLLVTIIVDVGVYSRPVKASTCFAGNACLTIAGKVGRCGGIDNCSCIGKDGSETPNASDCFLNSSH